MPIENELHPREENPEAPKASLDVRIMEARGALNDRSANSEIHPRPLRAAWLEGQSENVEAAVARALSHVEDETPVAKVVQHREADLSLTEDATFVNAYLVAFEAKATINGEAVPVGVMNFESVVS
ncbi:MAG TPA: hypothetical protein VF272_03220, partial [Candidatus Saccharimonadia bacterium]